MGSQPSTEEDGTAFPGDQDVTREASARANSSTTTGVQTHETAPTEDGDMRSEDFRQDDRDGIGNRQLMHQAFQLELERLKVARIVSTTGKCADESTGDSDNEQVVYGATDNEADGDLYSDRSLEEMIKRCEAARARVSSRSMLDLNWLFQLQISRRYKLDTVAKVPRGASVCPQGVRSDGLTAFVALCPEYNLLVKHLHYREWQLRMETRLVGLKESILKQVFLLVYP